MFEGLKGAGYWIKYGRQTKNFELGYKFALENSFFQCRYCKKDLGHIHEIQVTEFLEHMAKEHSDKVDMDQVKKFQKFFKSK